MQLNSPYDYDDDDFDALYRPQTTKRPIVISPQPVRQPNDPYPFDEDEYPETLEPTIFTSFISSTINSLYEPTTKISFPSTPTSVTSPPVQYPNQTIQQPGYRFPYPVLMIVFVWMILGAAYFVSRWRQRAKSMYIIPRVFVLCSPRTVQFHYELILRVGLPSYDFNPDKHDIDLSIQGQQKNEVVPVTRLNTKTLLDEPLITNLSLVVYRLVEMPPLGGLVLKHSGPFRAWVYAYDFTVIDLSTNKEQYYTLNQYIGSLDRVIPLDISTSMNTVNYPIDDVPLPQWTLEDIFLLLYTVVNSIMLVVTMMPINCTYLNDIVTIVLTALGAGCLVFFLDWLLYYYLRWNQDRREYFNDSESCRCCPSERITRIGIGIMATVVGLTCIYFAMSIDNLKNSIVWLLVVVNSCTIVIGLWNVSRQVEMGETIVSLGLKLRGIEMISVGMHYSDMVSDMRTKSGSTSDDGFSSVSMSSGKIGGGRIGIGPRSSVKSFGFDLIGGQKLLGSTMQNRSQILSSTGPQNNSQILTSSIRKHHKATGGGGAKHSTGGGSQRRVVIKSPPKQQQQQQQASKMPSSALTHINTARTALPSTSGLHGASSIHSHSGSGRSHTSDSGSETAKKNKAEKETSLKESAGSDKDKSSNQKHAKD